MSHRKITANNVSQATNIPCNQLSVHPLFLVSKDIIFNTASLYEVCRRIVSFFAFKAIYLCCTFHQTLSNLFFLNKNIHVKYKNRIHHVLKFCRCGALIWGFACFDGSISALFVLVNHSRVLTFYKQSCHCHYRFILSM